MTVKERIQSLKQKHNAIILAHYYVPDDLNFQI